MEQTAHKLGANAHTNFPMHGSEHGITMYGVWSVKHARTEMFVAHYTFLVQC